MQKMQSFSEFISGKRFMITHTIIQNFMGSTIVAMELAEFLIKAGAEVTVFSCYADNPMLKLFNNRKIHIILPKDLDDIHISNFDYVWIHSQIVPISFIEQINIVDQCSMPIFIFNHMSELDYAPDEYPYIFDFEESLSSLSLFVSENARRKQKKFYKSHQPPLLSVFPNRTGLFRNPAPDYFSDLEREEGEELRRIAVVSNHVPKELRESVIYFQERGIEVDFYGDGQKKIELIKPEILSMYDVVISIGKTVQYCLVSGTPIFIYDHFGGYGYLNEANYCMAAEANFSGRGGLKMTTESIVEAIINGYPDARYYHAQKRPSFINEYSISNVLPNIIKNIEKRHINKLNERILISTLFAQKFAYRHNKYWGETVRMKRIIQNAKKILG